MTYEPTANLLAFVLPLSFRKGDLTFYPATIGEEVRVAILPTNRPRQVVSTAQLTHGRWRARLNWSDGSSQYQDEKELFVP